MQSFKPYTIKLRGQLLNIERPLVMGIINITPDSFYGESRAIDSNAIIKQVESKIAEGADIIDIGGYSSRPGAKDTSTEEERDRIIRGIKAVRSINQNIPISIDTFRANVAEAAIAEGADIINDISGGNLDSEMFSTVAKLNVPYILMHMRGTPATMQSLTKYTNLVPDVIHSLAEKLTTLRQLGISDIIIDPGFGFSKTLEQNYELLASIPTIAEALNCPTLIGISRKSMITKALSITAEEALNGTTILNTIALLNGASILRVHDVKEAKQAVKLCSIYKNPTNNDVISS